MIIETKDGLKETIAMLTEQLRDQKELEKQLRDQKELNEFHRKLNGDLNAELEANKKKLCKCD